MLTDIITTKSRRVWTCPPHFIKVNIFDKEVKDSSKFVNLESNADKISHVRNWLYEHIEHRFFIGSTIMFENGLLIDANVVGFEDYADATYFTLVRPNLISE